MNIGFDAKRFFNNFTGLGNYSRFIIDALSSNYEENNYLLYSPKAKKNPEVEAIAGKRNIQVITPPAAFKMLGATSLWRSWRLSNEPTVKSLDVFHGLSQELPLKLPPSIKKIVTVHDLIFLRYPKLYNPLDVFIYTKKVSAACKQADKILATSLQTKQDVTHFLKTDPSKIEIVYQGCHPNFKKILNESQLTDIKTLYALPKQYILNVGTIEERKNVLLLIKAVALLPKELRMHVVIVGRPTIYMKQLIDYAQKSGMLEWLIFLHDVSFADLPAIYQGAQLFVYPSFFEGFGIPIIEALESSVPVIAATGSCLSEAGGPGSIYINPSDEKELAFQLERILTNDDLKKQMVAKGTRHVHAFQPNVIAERMMSVYKSA